MSGTAFSATDQEGLLKIDFCGVKKRPPFLAEVFLFCSVSLVVTGRPIYSLDHRHRDWVVGTAVTRECDCFELGEGGEQVGFDHRS